MCPDNAGPSLGLPSVRRGPDTFLKHVLLSNTNHLLSIIKKKKKI